MKKFISKFHNDNEEKMNFKLINRDFEEDLAEFIVEVFKFLEVIPSVKFLGWSLQNDESEILVVRRKRKIRKLNTIISNQIEHSSSQ